MTNIGIERVYCFSQPNRVIESRFLKQWSRIRSVLHRFASARVSKINRKILSEEQEAVVVASVFNIEEKNQSGYRYWRSSVRESFSLSRNSVVHTRPQLDRFDY